MKKIILKIKKWYCGLSDKKRHVELITAVLSIPMMLTVIFVNFNNIKKFQEIDTTNETTPIQVIITGVDSDNKNPPIIPISTTAITPTLIPTLTPTTTPTLTPTPTLEVTETPTPTITPVTTITPTPTTTE